MIIILFDYTNVILLNFDLNYPVFLKDQINPFSFGIAFHLILKITSNNQHPYPKALTSMLLIKHFLLQAIQFYSYLNLFNHPIFFHLILSF